ncbi:hypothetical protein N185_16640 [Sinorhizobium sp. GW3]|nr:hypothetical protein N185_16640 [Sinorhizobium sp. GW3]
MKRTPLSTTESRFWAWLCIGAIFANFLLDTMIAPALPAMGTTLGISDSQLGFVFTCGLLSSAIALPLGGRIADIWDKRLVLIGILVLSLIGSACAALATSFAAAAVGQALLGAGAILLPLGVVITTDSGEKEKSTALVFVSSGVSALAGLVIGAYLLDHYPYQSLFWMVFALNLVLLVVAVVAVFVTRNVHSRRIADARLDVTGGVLLGGALALLLYSTSLVGRQGLMSPSVGLPLAVSLALAVLWWRGALRASSPLIDPRQLLDPTVARFSLIQLATGFNATAVMVGIPMIVTAGIADGGLGMSEAISSYLFIPSSIVLFVAPMTTLPLRSKIGAGGVVVTGSVLIAAGTALLIITHAIPSIVAATVLGSLGLGLLLTQTFDLLAIWIEPDRVASVSGFILVLKIAGAAFGGQFAATMMELMPPEKGFILTMVIATLMICISIPASLRLGRRTKPA